MPREIYCVSSAATHLRGLMDRKASELPSMSNFSDRGELKIQWEVQTMTTYQQLVEWCTGNALDSACVLGRMYPTSVEHRIRPTDRDNTERA